MCKVWIICKPFELIEVDVHICCIAYSEVKGIVANLARNLSSFGCKKGSTIGIYGPNTPEWSQAMQVKFLEILAVCHKAWIM